MLAATTRLKLFYLFHFSKPAWNRAVYQAVSRRRIRRIVELGIGTGQRGVRLIEVAARHSPTDQIVYTGIDRFEDRGPGDGPGTSLKDAYRKLRATGARINLLPGDPTAVFSAAANNLSTADLVLISWPLPRGLLPRACYYLRRILHDGSLVLVEEQSQHEATKRVKVLPLDRIRTWAAEFRKAA
jgi:hypothetical protein